MKKLIQGCKRLDRKAQREMVNHLSPMLFPICLRYANSREDAKDLLQEGLILIFNNLESLSSDEVPVFKAWCRRITINNALAKKRKKIFPLYPLDDKATEAIVSPRIQSQLQVDDILSLLQKLPENHRIVFNLAAIDGYPHREIAEFLEIKESSSRTFLTRARLLLQDLLVQAERIKKPS